MLNATDSQAQVSLLTLTALKWQASHDDTKWELHEQEL